MDQSTHKQKGRLFRNFGVITIITVYLLILVGGIVRTTGSGMGCPDWPKCFGQYVPPTDVSQLPENYKEIFAVQGKEIADFNPVHTWIEYINRLLGALTGLFIFLTVIFSLSYWKSDRKVFWLSFFAFILVGLEGWIGAKVVSTDLKPVIITIHMVLALVVVAVLILAVARSHQKVWEHSKLKNIQLINRWIFIVLVLSLIQLVLGTQVREAIDVAMKEIGFEGRGMWLDTVGWSFYVHRSFSIILLVSNIWLVKLIHQSSETSAQIRKFAYSLLVLIGIEIFTGAIMGHFNIPAFAQPMHLLGGALIIGCQFFLALLVNFERLTANQAKKVEIKHS